MGEGEMGMDEESENESYCILKRNAINFHIHHLGYMTFIFEKLI